MVFTDNMGIFLAGLFRQPINGTKNISGMTSTTGAPISGNIYKTETDGLSLNRLTNNRIQVGKGTSIPTRQDLTIENPFTNGGLEDNPVLSITNYGYIQGSGLATKATVISPTFGSGIITEVVKFSDLAGNDIIWARDLLGTPASFIAGQAINVSNEVSI